MSYKELFSAIECNRIVIIEDDFKQGEYKKERALYDITRMAVDDRCRYLAEIESISQPLHEVLSKFLSLFDECFDKIGVWDDSIPYGDISCAFGLVESVNPELKVLLEEQYSRFEGEAVQKIYELGAKYGIGVNHPAYFDDLYNNYILSENRAQSLRIYTDFSADTQNLFSDDIGQAAPEHAIVCIIDNYLSGSNRAKEVIQVISDRNTGMRRNIIGSIFSSKEMYEEITDKSLGKGFCIGHSYFCGKDVCTDEWLHSIVDYDILPMLSEYWFDDTSKLRRWENILQGMFQ